MLLHEDGPQDEFSTATHDTVAVRASSLFSSSHARVVHRANRVFTGIIAVQTVLGIGLTLVRSHSAAVQASGRLPGPTELVSTWSLSAVALWLMRRQPGRVLTRQVVAAAQILSCAVLIDMIMDGDDSYYFVFPSLALLALYRDGNVLLVGSVVSLWDRIGDELPRIFNDGLQTQAMELFVEHTVWMAVVVGALYLAVSEQLREMRTLAGRQAAIETLTADIEQKVVRRTRELARSREQFRSLVESTQTMPWQWDNRDGRFSYVGPQATRLLGCPPEAWLQPGFWEARVHPDDRQMVERRWIEAHGSESSDVEFRLQRDDGTWAWVRCIFAAATDGAEHQSGFLLDVTERRRMELELSQAQKLESVGRLASGIAHEINTPVQFVSDSIYFLRDAFQDIEPLFARYRKLLDAVRAGPVAPELADEVEAAEEEADLGYLLENMPPAMERCIDGLQRVATLVRSMKEFAHPDQKEKVSADLNHALETTLTIARNEYKYVADVETSFQQLPPLRCHVNELNQVFLNLLVNAAHAIGDVVKGTDQRGKIRVATSAEPGFVEVRISDTGGGIPDHVRPHIFEPFFTTKEPGRGTGQGLAIARNVVVDKHGGTLSFDSRVGQGTTFTIRLPTRPATQGNLRRVA